MADHHHHDHPPGECAHAAAQRARGPAALAAAEAACKARGERLTPIRRAVLDELYATHRPLGAYDIIETLAGKGRKRLAPITIYRALDFLIEQGFAHRLASRNAFLACPHHHGADEAVVFLICEQCGGVDEAPAAEIGRALNAMAARERFTVRQPIIEIAGRCGHCAIQTGAAA